MVQYVVSVISDVCDINNVANDLILLDNGQDAYVPRGRHDVGDQISRDVLAAGKWFGRRWVLYPAQFEPAPLPPGVLVGPDDWHAYNHPDG